MSRRRRPRSPNPAHNVRAIPHTHRVAQNQYPQWAKAGQQTLDDLYWITVRAGIETDRPWVHGTTQTLSWLAGRSAAPISGRAEQPVTRAEAEAEKWYAIGYGDELLPLARICAELHVTNPPAIPDLDIGFVDGVARCLNWVLDGPGAHMPLDVPRRRPDGQVVCAQQRYDEAIQARGHHLLPEERVALRRTTFRQAAHDAVIADIIEDTRRTVGG